MSNLKNIYYLVGAYGCGKTTSALKFKNDFDNMLVLEDKAMLHFLSHRDFRVRSYFSCGSMYYKIINNIFLIEEDNLFKLVKNLIVDSHPMAGYLYLQAWYQVEHGQSVNMRDILYYSHFNFKIADHARQILDPYNQHILFINLPFEKHLDMVMGRYEEREENFGEESDIAYLRSVRSVFQQNVFDMGKELYNCEITEINDLKEIEKIIY